MVEQFYWRHARDSLLTPTALRMFQLVAKHNGEKFDDAKQTIDAEYRVAVGSDAEQRHGGIIQTQLQAFREAGWVTLEDEPGGSKAAIIQITPAGRQALLLLSELPDFLKAAPYFVVELLARLQLNNPARPEARRNQVYDAQLDEATVFPYWTLLKIIRSCEDYITVQELRRFVFQIKKQDGIPNAIQEIHRFRNAIASGADQSALDAQFAPELSGSRGEPKYLMGRLGTQVGKEPPLIEKEGQSIWRLNRYYIPMVDAVLSNEPTFGDYLDERTWMRLYGRPVELDPPSEVHDVSEPEYTTLSSQIGDDDSVLVDVRQIIESGGSGVLFSGPPGTSKTWYARQVAIKLVDNDPERVVFVQFHSSMAYDDFVEGYVPILGQQGASFEVRKKTFLLLCETAKRVSPKLCVLVIDEINRGDASRIFGELLTYVERSYRDIEFTTAYSGQRTTIPSNLFIIGTYNPYDKSVVDLDDAMDRRFERIAFDPSPRILKELLGKEGVDPALIASLIQYFVDVNKISRHGIGHTLFLSVKDNDSLRRLWMRKLRFIFEKAFRFEPDALNVAKQGYLRLFSGGEDPGI
jgi:5-methylcytosine-specific restriction protein B